MKVKELIAKLQNTDPEAVVAFHNYSHYSDYFAQEIDVNEGMHTIDESTWEDEVPKWLPKEPFNCVFLEFP